MKNILELMVEVCNEKRCTDCLHCYNENGHLDGYCEWCNDGTEYQADYEKVYKEVMKRLLEKTKGEM